MKTKVLTLIAVTITTVAIADPRYPSLQVDGKVYSNATLSRVENNEVVCIHTRGVARIPLVNLPPSVRKDVETAFGTQSKNAASKSYIPFERTEEVEKVVDRFENGTMYSLKMGEVASSRRNGVLLFTASCFVKLVDGKMCAVGGLNFSAGRKASDVLETRLSEHWPYANNHSLIFLIDDHRVKVGETDYKPDMPNAFDENAYYIESMSAMIPMSLMRQLIKAKKVEFQLGPTEQTLIAGETDKIRTQLALLISHMDKDFTNLVEITDGKTPTQE